MPSERLWALALITATSLALTGCGDDGSTVAPTDAGDGSVGDGSNDSDAALPRAQAVMVTCGEARSCALTTEGRVRCWGGSVYGALGYGTQHSPRHPIDVIGLDLGVRTFDSSSTHNCAVTAQGTVKCWGYNLYGQLAVDGLIESSVAIDMQYGLPEEAVAVDAGFFHSCALTVSGAIWCWGSNGLGALGNGADLTPCVEWDDCREFAPVQVVGLPQPPRQISANAQTCSVVSDGAVFCWGSGGMGELGNGTWKPSSTPTRPLGFTSPVQQVSAGLEHTCAVTTQGELWCWGGNDRGELGDGTTEDRNTPGRVDGLVDPVTAVAAGSSFTCALTQTGVVQCWGGGHFGQLGTGSTPFSQPRPGEPVRLRGPAKAITACIDHACAVLDDGSVQCWGENSSGELGDGIFTDMCTASYSCIQPTPVDVIGFGP